MSDVAITNEARNQENLKKSISTLGALGISFNQIVGGGIVSLTGVAIALTGGGVTLAFVLAAVSVMIVSIPYATIGSARPVVGGIYSYSTEFIHPTMGYGGLLITVLTQGSLGIYGIAAGQYMHSLNPWFNETATAIALILFFYFANMMGAVVGARLSIVMSVIMLVGFGIFIFFGMMQVDWVNYPPIMPNGFMNLLQAAALLTFATGGATVVVELGGELKNPARAIPIGILGGTALAAVMYVGVALISAGVLPIDQVANEPLSTVSEVFLPTTAWVFFILGGAMMAVISTMNAQLLTGTKSLLAAIDDGWFPNSFGAVNKRFGTPHHLLTFLLLVGISPVILNVPLGDLANAISGISQITFVFIIVAALRLRYMRPDLHDAAPFKLGLRFQWVLSIVGLAVSFYQAYLLFGDGVSTPMLITIAILIAVGSVWGWIRYPHVKRVREGHRLSRVGVDAEMDGSGHADRISQR